MRACGQTKVYFRELHNYIIFLQNFSELTISLLPEKNKLDSAYKLFKLAPDLIVPTVIMADTLQCTACARANPIHNLLPLIGIFPNTFSCYNILIKRLIISFILTTRNGVKQHCTRQLRYLRGGGLQAVNISVTRSNPKMTLKCANFPWLSNDFFPKI